MASNLDITVDPATASDLTYIDHLQKKNAEEYETEDTIGPKGEARKGALNEFISPQSSKDQGKAGRPDENTEYVSIGVECGVQNLFQDFEV